MNWQVDWLPDGEQDLAAVWLQAPDREAVTKAVSDLDRLLVADPEHAGESRPNGGRIGFAPPLGVIYRVLVDEHRVEVAHVWRFETH